MTQLPNENWIERNRTILLVSFCLCAAIRVFVFAAAFPFFNNVDEQLQTDVVVKYSLRHIPRNYERIGETAAVMFARYGSPEFLATNARAAEAGLTSPLWKDPGAYGTVAEIARDFQARRNSESSQPPFYYLLAGTWANFGRVFQLDGMHMLYWIRFLNVAIVVLLVWLAFIAARKVSDDRAIHLSVALLIAFIPQDLFYSIENDIPSALLGAIGFILLCRLLSDERISMRSAIATGLIIAAAYLTKIGNIPFVCLAILIVTGTSVSGKIKRFGPASVCLVVSLVPILLWMLWCKEQFGDVTGSAGKIAALGWTRKPFPQWWSHPIFTPKGAWTFLSDLLARFWRGEFSWHGQQLSSAFSDFFYAISSLIFPLAALFGLRYATTSEKRATILAGILFLSGLAFLALLSIQFDFGRCVYPSPQFPYFTSGRLITFDLVPFAILYIGGIATLLRWFGLNVSPLLAVATICLLITANEIWISRDVFASDFNWFHM